MSVSTVKQKPVKANKLSIPNHETFISPSKHTTSKFSTVYYSGIYSILKLS